MSSNAMTVPGVQIDEKPWVDTLHEWVTTVDHKRLGVLYILYALLFLVIAGVEALMIRIQLMFPHNDFVSPEVFNRLFTLHGTTMVFFDGHANPVWVCELPCPSTIGARDMAFPRLNAFSFWLSALGGFLLYFSLVVQTGFTARATLRTWDGGQMRSSDGAGLFARPQH